MSSSEQSSNLDTWLDEAVDIVQSSLPTDCTRAVLHRALVSATGDITVDQLQLDQRRLIFPVLKQSALALDERFIESFGLSPTLKKEYDIDKDGVRFLNRLISLATLLNEYDSDRTRDLSTALCNRAGAESDEEGLDIDVHKLPPEVKDECTNVTLGAYPLPAFHRSKTLRWILGDKRFMQWRKKFKYDHKKYVERLGAVLERSSHIREKMLLALDWFVSMPTLFLADAIGRQGWVHLAEETCEITDHEWWRHIEVEAMQEGVSAQVHDALALTMERSMRKHSGIAKRSKNAEMLMRHKNLANVSKITAKVARENAKLNHQNAMTLSTDAREFFDAHPEEPSAKKLVDIIDWKGWRKKLAIAKKERHATRIGALQKQLALDIFFHVERMESGRKEHVSSAEENRNGVPDYVRGLPTEVVKRKEASCFGGLWVIASLLLKCGITPEQLRFCHINKDDKGQIGAHAQLLLLTEDKEVLIIDFGYNVCGRELRLGGSSSGKTFVEMNDLLNGSRTDPVIWNADPYFTRRWKYPQSMIIMPVLEGFAHTHLWHTGIALLHEGKVQEAQEAFRMASRLCPQNPDVLYYRGLVASQTGDQGMAKKYFRDALSIFSGHLRSTHALGKIAALEGNEGEALKRLKCVAQDFSPIWGDDTFKKEAVAFMEEYKAAHPEEQEEPLTYQI